MRDSLIEHIDYYKDGDRVVFTALFHAQRRFCCGNKCRHCPYTPKHIKHNTFMELETLKQLSDKLKELNDKKADLSSEEIAVQTAGLFNELDIILREILKDQNNENIS